MTVLKTNAITLEEIIAIQFECRNCKVRVSVPISSQGHIPIKCPFCFDPWLVNNRTDLHQRFFMAVNQLAAAVKQVAEGSNNVNCVLSVEINPEIKPIHDEKDQTENN